jgi:hypothetical protein
MCLLFAGASLGSLQRVDLLLFCLLSLLNVRRHGAGPLLPLLGWIGEAGAKPAGFKLHNPGATFAVVDNGITLTSIVRATALLHKNALCTSFNRFATHNGITSSKELKVDKLTTFFHFCQYRHWIGLGRQKKSLYYYT